MKPLDKTTIITILLFMFFITLFIICPLLFLFTNFSDDNSQNNTHKKYNYAKLILYINSIVYVLLTISVIVLMFQYFNSTHGKVNADKILQYIDHTVKKIQEIIPVNNYNM